jgi:hypothetical protein
LLSLMVLHLSGQSRGESHGLDHERKDVIPSVAALPPPV